jgi:myotubularin-related protein 6/7/8
MTITRSSQPLVGLKKAKSLQDKKLVESIFQTGSKTSSTHYIMDARPAANAMAQTALGAGTESTDDYPNCHIMFLGIDNIHAVRDSMTKMMDVLKSQNTSLSFLEKTGWMKLVRIILKGTVNIVQCLDKKSCHVLIHCR